MATRKRKRKKRKHSKKTVHTTSGNSLSAGKWFYWILLFFGAVVAFVVIMGLLEGS